MITKSQVFCWLFTFAFVIWEIMCNKNAKTKQIADSMADIVKLSHCIGKENVLKIYI